MKVVWCAIRSTLTVLVILYLLFAAYKQGLDVGYIKGAIAEHTALTAKITKQCQRGAVVIEKDGVRYFCSASGRL